MKVYYFGETEEMRKLRMAKMNQENQNKPNIDYEKSDIFSFAIVCLELLNYKDFNHANFEG